LRDKLERVVVVGTSCCGKTAFAGRLAQALVVPRIELDELYWASNWTPKPNAEFRGLVQRAADRARWVADGNYSGVRDLLWPRATSIVWLNYSFVTVFGHALRRTIRRIIHREELFAGNRESIRRSFFSRDSILFWVITTFHRRRKEYEVLRNSNTFRELEWIEFRRPSEAEAFLTDAQA
jgi:adenylate kinase family enzyme